MKKTFVSTAILFLFFLYNSYGQSAEQYFKQAQEKMLSRDFSVAVSLYDKVIAIDPGYVLAYYNRGIVKLNILRDTIGGCSDLKKASEFEFTKADKVIIKFCK